MQPITSAKRLPPKTKRPLAEALRILVEEDIITATESEDISSIIDIRNQIGHSIHDLVSDISFKFRPRLHPKLYDYGAVDRLQRYRSKIELGMNKEFWLSVSPRELIFEQAAKTYEEELSRLRRRIARLQAKARRNRVVRLTRNQS